MSTNDLLRTIHNAAAEMGITPATLCQRAAKHSKLPRRLEAGGSATLETADRIERWIDDQRKRLGSRSG